MSGYTVDVLSRPRYSRAIDRPDLSPPDPLAEDGQPWAMAVNAVARVSDAELTVLSLVVVGRTIRLTAVLRVLLRPDVSLRSVPELRLRDRAGPPLQWLRAHVLPDPPNFWLDWTFQQPTRPVAGLTGSIESLELTNRTGSRSEKVVGPWRFDVSPPGPTEHG